MQRSSSSSYHLVPLDGLGHPDSDLAGELYDPYKEYDRMGVDDSAPEPDYSAPKPKAIGDYPVPPSTSARSGRRHTGWSPIIMQLPPLLLFILFLLVLIALAEVFVSGAPYTAPESAGLLFLWTYGPPALVVLIDWIWELYDLQVKVMQPWSLLFRGALPHEHPWLLDYRSVNYCSAIWHAFSHLHFVILVSYIGYWIAAVASVMSTSLWDIQDLTQTLPASFTVTAAMPESPIITPEMWDDGTYLNFFFSHQIFDLSRPRWMTDENIIMQPFELPQNVRLGNNVTQFADTAGYSARLNCSNASAQYAGNVTTEVFNITISTENCSAYFSMENLNAYYDGIETLDVSYYAYVMEHTCPGNLSPTTFLSSVTLLNGTEFESTTVGCVPQYQRYTVAAVVPPGSDSPPVTSRIAYGPSTFNFGEGASFLSLVNNNTYDLIQSGWADLGNVSEQYMQCDPWYSILLLANNITFDALMNPGTLESLSQSAFAEIWGNFVSQSLFVAPEGSAATIQGTVEATSHILQAREASVRVLQAMLITMVCCALLVYASQPRTNLPLDPSSLAGMAALLNASDSSVMTALRGTGEMTEAQFKARMKKWKFSTGRETEFLLSAEKVHEEDDETKDETQNLYPAIEIPRTRRHFWRPIMLHPISQILVLGLVAASIVVLEPLYWYSKAHNGLAATPLSGVEPYAWSYVAPLYVAILGLITQAHASSVRTLQPYNDMAQGPQSVQKSIGYNPVSHTGISLLWHSLKTRSLMGLVSAVSLLLAPFMKIAVAGLLVSSPQLVTSSVQLTATSTFNATVNVTALSRQSDDQNGTWRDAQIWSLSQIPSYGLPLPAWTTTRDAIGSVDLSNLGLASGQNVTLQLRLPALSTELTDCSLLSSDDYLLYTIEGAHPTPELMWPANATNGEDACYTRIDGFPPDPGYFGQINPGDATDFCQNTFFVIYGYTTGPAIANITDLTVIKCGNNMTLSTKDVILGISSSSNASSPTIISVNDSSAENVQVVADLDQIPLAFQSSYAVIPGTLAANNETESFDGFFQVLVSRNTSAPLSAYLDADVLLPTAQKLWTSYWAVWTSSNMRLPLNISGGQNVSGLLQTQQARVVQQPVPTRVLEALLGGTLVCGIISDIVLRKCGGVLPKGPYSIGAQMSLLVDSSLLDMEVMHEELDASAISEALRPYRFELGWRNDRAGNPRFGVDIE